MNPNHAPAGGEGQLKGGEFAPARTNQHAQLCEDCGKLVQPGEGNLHFVPDAHDDDDFARVGTHKEHAHWEVRCSDREGCAGRVKEIADYRAKVAAESKAKRDAENKVKAEEKKVKQEAWAKVTAGLERTESGPKNFTRTGEFFDNGQDTSNEKIMLTDDKGEVTGEGWLVSWLGDQDGSYFLLPGNVKAKAEEEKKRLHRIYQWWRPGNYNPDSYPGPGVPEEELSSEEKAEVAGRFADKWKALEDREKRFAEIAVEAAPVYKNLLSLGAEVKVHIPTQELKSYVRAKDQAPRYSKEAEALKLVPVLQVKLPSQHFTNGGELKAAIKKRLPRDGEQDTNNRFVKLKVEYV